MNNDNEKPTTRVSNVSVERVINVNLGDSIPFTPVDEKEANAYGEIVNAVIKDTTGSSSLEEAKTKDALERMAGESPTISHESKFRRAFLSKDTQNKDDQRSR
jgi:hypothetical protein